MVQSYHMSKNEDFSVSLLAFWVKGNMSVDEYSLKIRMQNTVFFGLIPAGIRKDTSPLGNISNVYISKGYKLGRMLLGAVVSILGLSIFGDSFLGGLFVLILGLAIIGSSIVTVFCYEKNGIERQIELPFFESYHAEQFAEEVEEELKKYADNRDIAKQNKKQRRHTEKQTKEMVGAIKSSKRARYDDEDYDYDEDYDD